MSPQATSVEQTRTLLEEAIAPALMDSLQGLFAAADEAVLKQACEASENKEQNRFFEAAQALRIVRNNIQADFLQLLVDPAFELDVDALHLQSLRSLLSISVCGADRAAEQNLTLRLQALKVDYRNPLSAECFIECFLRALANSPFDIHIKMLVLRLFEAQTYAHIDEFIEQANLVLIEQGVLPELGTNASADDSVADIVQAALGVRQQEKQRISVLESALADLQSMMSEALLQGLDADAVLAVSELDAVDYITELNAELGDFDASDIERMDVVRQLFSVLLQDDALPLPARYLLSLLQLPFTRLALLEEAFLTSQTHAARTLLSLWVDLSQAWQPSMDAADLARDSLFMCWQDIVQAFYSGPAIRHETIAEQLFSLIAYAEQQRQRQLDISAQMLGSANAATSADIAREQVVAVLADKVAAPQLPDAVQRILSQGWNHVLYVQALSYGVDSEQWQVALKVVEDLIDSVRPAQAYSSRQDFLTALPPLLHALRMGMYVIELSSTLIYQLLADLEQVHKTIIVAIPDSGDLLLFTGSALSKSECPSALPLIAARKAQIAQELEAQLEADSLQKTEASLAETGQNETAQEKISKEEAQQDEAGQESTAEDYDAAGNAVPEEVAVAEVPQGADSVVEATDSVKDVLSALGQGVWIIWHKADKKERCQVAAHIKHTQKYILTNSGGAKIAEILETDMAQLMNAGEIELAESGHVFEKALESVIGGIRDKR